MQSIGYRWLGYNNNARKTPLIKHLIQRTKAHKIC